jgi:hypothetical protein
MLSVGANEVCGAADDSASFAFRESRFDEKAIPSTGSAE